IIQKLSLKSIVFNAKLIRALANAAEFEQKNEGTTRNSDLSIIVKDLVEIFSKTCYDEPVFNLISVFSQGKDLTLRLSSLINEKFGNTNHHLNQIMHKRAKSSITELSESEKIQISHLFDDYLSFSTSNITLIEYIMRNIQCRSDPPKKSAIIQELIDQGLIANKGQLADFNRKGVWSCKQDDLLKNHLENSISKGISLNNALKEAKKSIFLIEKPTTIFLKDRIKELGYDY
ncbi:MAG: hypothetical protein MHPSP_003769, partial [Paramarteilia canceri]